MSETAEVQEDSSLVRVSPVVKRDLIQLQAQMKADLGRRLTFNEVIEKLIAGFRP